MGIIITTPSVIIKMVNKNIKLRITKTGQVIFYGIAEKQIHRYVERLNHYNTSYKVIHDRYNLGKVFINFSEIELKLFKILVNYYILTDYRKYKLVESKETIYFYSKHHIVCTSEELVPIFKNHFNESKKAYRLFRMKTTPIFVLNEISLASKIDLMNYCYVVDNISHINKDRTMQKKINIIKEIHNSLKPQNNQVFNFGTSRSAWINNNQPLSYRNPFR